MVGTIYILIVHIGIIFILDPVVEERSDEIEESEKQLQTTEEIKEETKEKRNDDLEGIIDNERDGQREKAGQIFTDGTEMGQKVSSDILIDTFIHQFCRNRKTNNLQSLLKSN
jgi:hypothetical protein